MPAQKPGESRQDYQTPKEFISAVENRFGEIRFDFAASRENAIHPNYFGPGSRLAEDALAPTANWQGRGLGWLNPPFGLADHFAARCHREALPFGPRRDGGAEILLLVPAAVCTEWFTAHVYLRSRVFFLRPRITFVGEKAGYPMGLILAHFSPKVTPGFETWRWDGAA
jgi:hypothetical protein